METKDMVPTPARRTRRTRIVCISDTHNDTSAKIPKGDVLIHAGDLTNKGSYSELSKTVQWLERLDFEAKIVIAGNHDMTLDSDFFEQHGHEFRYPEPQDPAKNQALLRNSPTITYLCDESATIRLCNPAGPMTEFKVYGSPRNPRFGLWAFQYGPKPHADVKTFQSPEGKEVWSRIPPDTDILVTHPPAATHCDNSRGCEDLREALARVRPRLHVCGHVHEARGAERLSWQLGAGSSPASVASTETWEDPHPDPLSAKMSLVDLTGRGGNRPLDFDNTLPPGRAASPDAGTGRRETCLVNCAILGPRSNFLGKRGEVRKAIVVDLDLPVAE